MHIDVLPVGPLSANAYLLTVGRRAVLVDPGGEPERLLEALGARNAELHAVWLTHAHFDHVGALAELLETVPVPVYLHPADAPLLASAADAAAAWGVRIRQPPLDTRPLADGDRLTLGAVEAHCLHTPGHAPGHVAIYLAAQGVVLSGDALFRGSIGRTDLPFGDHDGLLRSIRERLLVLPGDTRVLPGHGPATTIAEEAASNPFLTGAGLRPTGRA